MHIVIKIVYQFNIIVVTQNNTTNVIKINNNVNKNDDSKSEIQLQIGELTNMTDKIFSNDNKNEKIEVTTTQNEGRNINLKQNKYKNINNNMINTPGNNDTLGAWI